MLSKEIAQQVLGRCLVTGGDFAEIFEEDTNIDYVWKIVESARRQKHGTMLLFTENALSESERLREAG